MSRKKRNSKLPACDPSQKDPEPASVRIGRLQPHPRQDELFPPLPPHEFDALVQDIGKRGLQQLPDVLPANAAGLPAWTIIAGHQRILAALALGWKEIKVRIRHDLADKSSDEIEEALIADNFFRRQLSRLQQARCMLRLYEIELGRAPGRLCDFEKLEARKRVARKYSCSEKTVSRKLDVLTTPFEIQTAFDTEQLKIDDAVKVAHLPADFQAEIAAKIRDGAAPRKVVKEYIRRKPITTVQKSPLVKVNRLLEEIKELVPSDLDGIAAECPLFFAEDMLRRIEDIQPVIVQLTEALQRAKIRGTESFDQLVNVVRQNRP